MNGLVAVAVVAGIGLLWSATVGAARTVWTESRRDLSNCCPAWVPIPDRQGRLYRCGRPLRAGHEWCHDHEDPEARQWEERRPDHRRVDVSRKAGEAWATLRWSVPLAVAGVIAIAFFMWLGSLD